jgi:hypothetical protein
VINYSSQLGVESLSDIQERLKWLLLHQQQSQHCQTEAYTAETGATEEIVDNLHVAGT